MMGLGNMHTLTTMGCQFINNLILYKTMVVGDIWGSTFNDIIKNIKAIDNTDKILYNSNVRRKER